MELSWQPLSLDEWPRVDLRHVLAFQAPDQRLVDAGLKLILAYDDGLGQVMSTGARLPNGRVCALNRYLATSEGWVVELEPSQDMLGDVNAVLTALCVLDEEITWIPENYSFPQVEVCRQDDNGIEFIVGTFRFEAQAAQVVARLSSGGHKQAYWVRPARSGA